MQWLRDDIGSGAGGACDGVDTVELPVADLSQCSYAAEGNLCSSRPGFTTDHLHPVPNESVLANSLAGKTAVTASSGRPVRVVSAEAGKLYSYLRRVPRAAERTPPVGVVGDETPARSEGSMVQRQLDKVFAAAIAAFKYVASALLLLLLLLLFLRVLLLLPLLLPRRYNHHYASPAPLLLPLHSHSHSPLPLTSGTPTGGAGTWLRARRGGSTRGNEVFGVEAWGGSSSASRPPTSGAARQARTSTSRRSSAAG